MLATLTVQYINLEPKVTTAMKDYFSVSASLLHGQTEVGPVCETENSQGARCNSRQQSYSLA